MNELPAPPSDLNPLLDLLAVLGRASHSTLSTLLGAPLPPSRWRSLAQQPGVSEAGDELILLPSVAGERLEALEQNDRLLYRRLHQEAIDLLAKALAAQDLTTQDLTADASTEERLITLFKRLADHLLSEREESFPTLVAAAQTWPCLLPSSLQWRHYYQGVCELERDNYAAAIASFDELLSIEGLEERLRGRTLNSRANGYRVKGRLEDALKGYQESLAIWQRCGDEKSEGKALLNMGMAAYYLQDYQAAERWLAAGLLLFRKLKMVVLAGAAENGLGLLCRDQGRWDDALRYFQSYIAHSEARGSADSVSVGLLNRGEVLLFQGQLEEAIQTFHRSLAQMQRRLYEVDLLLHLGLAYWASERLADAQEAFAGAAQLAYSLDRQEILPHVEYWLAILASTLGSAVEAETHLLKAVHIIEETRSPIHDEGLKISLLGRWQQVYEALVLYYVDNNRPAEAFRWAERARARAFAEALIKATSGMADADMTNTSTVDAGMKEAGEIEQPDLQTVTAAALQDALPAGARLLCYFTTGVLASDIPLLSAIPAHNPLRKQLLISARTLCFAISGGSLTVRECAIDPNLFTMVSPRGYDLNQWLDPAVLDHLRHTLLASSDRAPEITSLLIVPHGPLHLVPFVALLPQSDEPAQPEPTVTYAPNATLLWHSLQETRPTSTDQSALAIGYNGSTQGQPLRYTEVEVQSVATILAGEAMVGPDPKKDRLLAAAQDKAWLHFACHGWFNYEMPLASYLHTGEDERISALEVKEEWQLRARLVTLSACQTGVSRVLRGDEPMGLVRAFLSAGAQAVLVTQWPVEDLATCLLMIRFYQEVAASPAPDLSRALTLAQQWLRRLTIAAAERFLLESAIAVPAGELSTLPENAPYPFAHPRYWAAFRLVVGS